MSKKKLLSESQVRRFMGLAGLSPINESYGMDEDVYEQKEEPMMEAEEEMPEMDMEEEPEMEGGEADVEMDEEDLADVKSALDTLQDKLAPLLDQAEGGEEMPEEEPEMDMGEPEPAEDEDMDMDLQEVEMGLTEEEKEEQMEEIVNEVARRVAKRIVEAKRAHKKMNEALGRKK
jgi:hypothetical protein